MTKIAGTTDTYGYGGANAGNREDLEGQFWDLAPMDTWLLTNMDKVDGSNIYHEWMGDNLVGATANRQFEGDDAAYSTVNSGTRYGNYHQISRKTFLISRTQDRVATADRKKLSARQAMKQMKELKRDMELALVGNQASSAGGIGTARSAGGIEAWIASTDRSGNGVKATTTSSASTIGFSGGVVVAPTDGTTTGGLTETALKKALGLAWADGGNPSTILVGTTQKTAIDAFTGVATRFVDVAKAQQASIVGAANVYVSDYGVHNVILHRYMRTSVVLCLDPEFLALSFIDAPFMEELAKTGDGRKFQIVAEYTLVVRNPNAHGKVVACT